MTSPAMEQQLFGKFLETTAGGSSPSLHALYLAKSIIINPSSSESTISSIFETLVIFLDSNTSPNSRFLHHIFALLFDLSLHRPNLRHHIFTAVRSFSLRTNNSTRSVADSLSLLISIAEQDEVLVPLVAEISEGLFLTLCFGHCISVRHWLLLNAKRLLVRPSLLITVFLGFTKDPYPYIRKVALDGLSRCIVTEDRGMMEGCYCRAVELLSDMEDCVRHSAIRVVSEWGKVLVASSEGESKLYWSDALFEQLCSIVRDMSVNVRLEAFEALGKIEMASENILLQTLSKKVLIKTQTSNVAGAFVHGLEDEYHEVRRSVCSCLRPLSILSADFSCKALTLLVDMLNDDSIAVRLEALQTVHDMANHDHQVLEQHLNMLLSTLCDTSASVRSEARKIIQLLKLHNAAMFKLCVYGLIQNLESYPQDEADIFCVLFNIGRSHGSYAVSIIEATSNDIDGFFEGKLGFNGAKTALFLVLAISAPFSSKMHLSQIPPRMFSYAVTLLGRISSCLASIMDRDVLFSYLCGCSRSSASDLDTGEKPLQQTENESLDKEWWEIRIKQVSHMDCKLDGDQEVVALVKLIFAQVNNIWFLIQAGYMREILRTLRGWKKELENINMKSPQSVGVSDFSLKYIQVLKLFGKVWTHLMSPRKLLSTGELDFLLGKLECKLREISNTFLGLSKEAVGHLLELILVTYTIKLSSFEPWCHQSTMKKVHSTFSTVELLLDDGSIEPSVFLVELKKSLHEISIYYEGKSSNPFLFNKLLELFSLKQVVLSGRLKHVKAELEIINNSYETPLYYVSGLPVGIPLQITLYNIVLQNRLWLRVTVNQVSYQYVYLDMIQFGDCDAVKKLTFIAPFYRVPRANVFTLSVSIGMECLSGDIISSRNCRGPKHELVYLCKEKQVYLSVIVK